MPRTKVQCTCLHKSILAGKYMLFTFKRQTQYKVECSLSLSLISISLSHTCMHMQSRARACSCMHQGTNTCKHKHSSKYTHVLDSTLMMDTSYQKICVSRNNWLCLLHPTQASVQRCSWFDQTARLCTLRPFCRLFILFGSLPTRVRRH